MYFRRTSGTFSTEVKWKRDRCFLLRRVWFESRTSRLQRNSYGLISTVYCSSLESYFLRVSFNFGFYPYMHACPKSNLQQLLNQFDMFYSALFAGTLLPFTTTERLLSEWGLLNFSIVLMLKYQAQLCPWMPLCGVQHGANRTHANGLERIPFSRAKDVWIIMPPLLLKQEDVDAKPEFSSTVKEERNSWVENMCMHNLPGQLSAIYSCSYISPTLASCNMFHKKICEKLITVSVRTHRAACEHMSRARPLPLLA